MNQSGLEIAQSLAGRLPMRAGPPSKLRVITGLAQRGLVARSVLGFPIPEAGAHGKDRAWGVG
jgi:hypothetical protein